MYCASNVCDVIRQDVRSQLFLYCDKVLWIYFVSGKQFFYVLLNIRYNLVELLKYTNLQIWRSDNIIFPISINSVYKRFKERKVRRYFYSEHFYVICNFINTSVLL